MKTLLTISLFTLLINVASADTGRLGISLQDAEKIWGKSEKREPIEPAISAHKFRAGSYYIVAQVWQGSIHEISIRKYGNTVTEKEISALCKKIGGDGAWPEKGFRRIKGDKKVLLQIIGLNSKLQFRTKAFEKAVNIAETNASEKELNGL